MTSSSMRPKRRLAAAREFFINQSIRCGWARRSITCSKKKESPPEPQIDRKRTFVLRSIIPTRRSAIGWTTLSSLLLFLLSGGLSTGRQQQPLSSKRSPVERMETAHLKATHEEVLRLQ